MTATRQPLWTLDELGTRVALALAVDYAGPANGQIRAVPDRRTIRYYTTLGLVDRPAELRGRTALYGRRHLLQIVAIKRLQARGLALAEIQEKLLGLGDRALERLAQLPADASAGIETPAAADLPAERAAFWAALPAPVGTEEAGPDGSASQPREMAIPFQGVPLAGEVTLLLAAVRPLDEDDMQAIRIGAAPLLKLLEKRRLLRPAAERNTR